jgi:hypothetical protein
MTSIKRDRPVSWLASFAKRQYVRHQILAGADYAIARTPPDTASRLILESRRNSFIKNFDIEDGSQAEMFAAIEAAFHIGKHAGLTQFAEEGPPIIKRNNTEPGRKSKGRIAAERRAALREAILACVDGDLTRLSSYDAKPRPSRDDVLERLQKNLSALKPTKGWPRISTILKEIRDLKKSR